MPSGPRCRSWWFPAQKAQAAAQEVRAFGAIGFLRKDSDLALIEAAIARALEAPDQPLPQPALAQT
jgi:hypothetical protein